MAAFEKQFLVFREWFIGTCESRDSLGDAIGVVHLLAKYFGAIFLVEGLREGHSRPADEVVLVGLDF